ncbi:MAG: IS3 family transposase [Tractidigestivibacter sp.]|jgi:transposase InsO family protein/transposase-like protein|uniref:IS3 family transposase n=1 Tax=Tractidigestivibacter sp. TaxID=2847320 RepID=UPI003D913F4F
MYKKEERERFLAELRDSGMPVAAFARLPGKPGRRTLVDWIAQAEAGELDVPESTVPGRCEHVRHARYPEATRREALRLLARGARPCDVARRLGISSGSVVSSWARRAEAAAGAPPARPPRPTRAELEAEVEELRAQVSVLREMVRDPKAGDPARLSNRRKAELGERLRRGFGLSLRQVLSALGISKSSYEYARRAAERDAGRAEEVGRRARGAFESSGRTYGYRRVWAAVNADGGGRVSQREVRAAMRAGGMVARRTRRRARYSSYAGEPDERPANLPLSADGRSHDFSAPAPDRMVVTDVTEFRVGGGRKVYLSPVVDCFDGMPVSWSASTSPDAGLCVSSLRSYLSQLPGGHGPVVVHTDGGCQYRSGAWKALCAERGATRSMSRKGRCGDNARAEGFFGTLKEEFYNGRDWSGVGPEEFVEDLGRFIGWYRSGRLKRFGGGAGSGYETIAGRRRRLGYATYGNVP